jgi:hypothetical protein
MGRSTRSHRNPRLIVRIKRDTPPCHSNGIGTAVPEDALQRMMERWEVPDATEADEVEWWVNGERRSR